MYNAQSFSDKISLANFAEFPLLSIWPRSCADENLRPSPPLIRLNVWRWG